MRRALACVTVVTFVVVGAGCGDDEERLSEEEFLEQGNAICEEGNDEIDAAIEEIVPDESTEPSIEEVITVYEETLIPSVQRQIDELRELNPPEDIEDDIEDLLDDADAAVEESSERLEEDPEAFVTSDEDPFAEVNARAEELGLTACGE
jgi:hypothetical protein